MHSRTRLIALFIAFGAGAVPAAAQVIANGHFETGAFAPWTVVNTPFGQSLATGITTFDTDDPDWGNPPSFCAQFMAGQTTPDSGPQGVTLQQVVTLHLGHYTFRCDWATRALVTVPGVSSGIFEFMVNGVPVSQVTAPELAAGERAHGSFGASFTIPEAGSYTVGIRITRPIGAGYEVFQLMDNAVISCRIDWDHDGIVAPADVAAFIYIWFTDYESNAPDFDQNGVVEPADVAAFVYAWFFALQTRGGC